MNDSGKVLEEIMAAVQKVNDIVAKIAAASEDQRTGIEHVNKAVLLLGKVTQKNAALTEETAAASASLSEQARVLNEIIAFFSVDHAETPSAPGI